MKNVMSSVGDNTGDFAKWFGPAALDLAKRVGPTVVDAGKVVGSNTAHLARRVGVKRGLLGVALIGVAVGGSIFLVRYLRDRKAAMEDQAPGESTSPPSHGVRRGGSKRKANRQDGIAVS